MVLSCFRFLVVVCGCAGLLGCSSKLEPRNPKTLPYVLNEVKDLGEHVQTADLDGDYVDEIIRLNYDGEIEAVLLATQDNRNIEQVNYAGKVDHPVHFLDVNDDNLPEILVPLIRNDSLFVSFVDANGQKLFHFFLIDGQPRREDNGTLPWDPEVKAFYLRDLDGNGQKELITLMSTGYARLPRGVLVHRLPDGQLLGQKIVGGLPEQSFLGDFDHDGHPQLIVETVASNNGADVGGFSDQHSYLLVFDLVPTPEVTWSRKLGDEWTDLQLIYDDFDGNGREEFLAFTSSRHARPERARLEFIEPGTWNTYRQAFLAEPLAHPQVVDLDRDDRPEIIATRAPGDVWVINHQFEVVRRRRVANSLWDLHTAPDLDGDGVDEVIVLTTSNEVLLLGPQLQVKASFPAGAIEDGHPGYTFQGIMQRGIGEASYLLVQKDGKVVALALVKNSLYWLYRYGPPVLWILGIMAILSLALVMHRQRQRTQLLQRVQAVALDTADRGLLLLGPDQRVELVNTTLRHWLDLPGHRSVGLDLDTFLRTTPDLVACLHNLTVAPARRREVIQSFRLGGREREMQVIADPLPGYRARNPYWLIRMDDRSKEQDIAQNRAWGLMAQRIAHDLKNPLTSILLTLQRLQMEYRTQAPEAAEVLDIYSERIIDRMEHLRRMTRNFMKFVDLEEPTLVDMELSAFVQQCSEPIRRGLPPDIQLTLKLATELPIVRVDQEQMQAVLENLVSNAVNAMLEGGTITMATHLAQALQFPGDPGPQDYVVLEVLDTGHGMSEAERQLVFDLGFTTVQDGMGLGLAVVKKIIAEHGGHIEVESEPGTGSAFSIYVPVKA